MAVAVAFAGHVEDTGALLGERHLAVGNLGTGPGVDLVAVAADCVVVHTGFALEVLVDPGLVAVGSEHPFVAAFGQVGAF